MALVLYSLAIMSKECSIFPADTAAMMCGCEDLLGVKGGTLGCMSFTIQVKKYSRPIYNCFILIYF